MESFGSDRNYKCKVETEWKGLQPITGAGWFPHPNRDHRKSDTSHELFGNRRILFAQSPIMAYEDQVFAFFRRITGLTHLGTDRVGPDG